MIVVGNRPFGVRLAGKHKCSRALLVDHKVLRAKVLWHETHDRNARAGRIVRHCAADMHVRIHPGNAGACHMLKDLPYLTS